MDSPSCLQNDISVGGDGELIPDNDSVLSWILGKPA